MGWEYWHDIETGKCDCLSLQSQHELRSYFVFWSTKILNMGTKNNRYTWGMKRKDWWWNRQMRGEQDEWVPLPCLRELPHLNISTSPVNDIGIHFHAHFTNEDIDILKSKMTCLLKINTFWYIWPLLWNI